MIVMEMEQGTEEWHQAKLGVPSASNFKKIVTSTGAVSKQQAGYLNELLAERMAGHPLEGFKNGWMERGNELEAEARDDYEWTKGIAVQQVGFVVREDGKAGCSPDGLIGDDGLIEIKCPSPGVHVSYLRAGKVPTDYFAQVQGQLWICERQWCDFVSYHPDLPALVVRVDRDEKFIEKLETAVLAFAKELQIQAKILERKVA